MEELKFILNELNKDPLKKELNFISYDNLTGEQKLKILFDIFNLIDNSINVDLLKNDEPDEIFSKVLDTLRIYKYIPPIATNSSQFREDLIIGKESTYTHIFYFLLKNKSDLQKRAYLAKFLVKLEVSNDLQGDNEIVEMYTKYENLIENFKVSHSKFEQLKKKFDSIQDVQKDVKEMELEKERINHKLDEFKRKENINTNSELLTKIKILNEEKELIGKMLKQKQQIVQDIELIFKKYNSLNTNYNELSKFVDDVDTVETFFVKLEEEVNSKHHLIEKILPKEIVFLEKYLNDLEQLDFNNQTSSTYLDNLNKKIVLINEKINEKIENRMLTANSEDEKLTTLKKNTETALQKKINLEKEVNDLENELNELNKKLDEKKIDSNGNEILVGNKLKDYMKEFKKKNAEFIDKNQELNEYKKEIVVLVNTKEILSSNETKLYDELISLEERRGILGYFTNKENLCIQVNLNEDNLDPTNFKLKIEELNSKIEKNKIKLSSLIQNLKPLRIKRQDMQRKVDLSKSNYDSIVASLESKVFNMQQFINSLEDKIKNTKTNFFKTDCEVKILNYKKKWIQKNQTKSDENLILEKMENEIKQELLKNENLLKRQKYLEENEFNAIKQIKLWSDLGKLIKIKLECFYDEKMQNQQKIKTKDYLEI